MQQLLMPALPKLWVMTQKWVAWLSLVGRGGSVKLDSEASFSNQHRNVTSLAKLQVGFVLRNLYTCNPFKAHIRPKIISIYPLLVATTFAGRCT